RGHVRPARRAGGGALRARHRGARHVGLPGAVHAGAWVRVPPTRTAGAAAAAETGAGRHGRPIRKLDERRPRDEEDRGDHPARPAPDGAGRTRRAGRVRADRDRGHGLRPAEGLHRAVPRLPINHRVNDAPHHVLKEFYSCEVAGRTLESANLFALRAKVASALEMIAPARTLPLAYFRVPAMDYSLPVYEDDGEIVSPVLSGPKLKADELAGIREAVCRYLISAGYVEDESEVAVGVLRPRDL